MAGPSLSLQTSRLANFPALCAHPTQYRRKPRSSGTKVPVTILTGYLGAGKTTLLQHILKAYNTKKIAVILNEFGNSGDIDSSLIAEGGGNHSASVLIIANGCICCSARKPGVDAIKSMLENEQTLDCIILEATGLADPGNIQALIQDPQGLGEKLFVNNIITVVDAKNIQRSLNEPVHELSPSQEIVRPAAARIQLQYADIVILNKIDLVSPIEVEQAKSDIASVNPVATMHVTTFSKVPNLIDAINLRRHTSTQELLPKVAAPPSNHLDPQMTTISLSLPILNPDQAIRFESWIRSMLWDTVFSDLINQHYHLPSAQTSSLQIHRIKGRLALSDGSSRLMQGVREGFEISEYPTSVALVELGARGKISSSSNKITYEERPNSRRSASADSKSKYSRGVGNITRPVFQRSFSLASKKQTRSGSSERPRFKRSATDSQPGKIVLIGRGLVKERFQQSMLTHVLSVA